jgi:hypothetical protein
MSLGMAGGCFVFSLLNRHSQTQVRPCAPGGTQLLQSTVATAAPAIPSSAQQSRHAHPLEIARALNGLCSRVLVDALTPALMGSPEPYVPETADNMCAAQWLALPVVGLLAADLAGYTACFRPTPLGRAVVQAMLSDAVLQRQYGSAGTSVAAAPTVWLRQAAPAAYLGTSAQSGQTGTRHAR